jgi:outer membrane protein assembly factor BamB
VEDGSVVWTRKLGGAANDILVVDDRIYVGSDDNFLYALDTLTGKVLWRWRTGGDVVGLPSADGSRLYFVSLDNVLRALDLRTGNQRWKRTLPVRPIAGPVSAGSTLVVSGLTPPLRAFRMSDGTPAGELPAKGEMAGPPHVLAHGVVPVLIVPTRVLGAGATITAMSRSPEPAIAPLAPLPTPIATLPPL